MASITLEGLGPLKQEFKALAEMPKSKAVEIGLLRAAKKLRNKVRAAAPMGPTGNLRRSIIAKSFKQKSENNPAVFIAIDSKIAPHAYWVEFGISHDRYPGKQSKKIKQGETWHTTLSKGVRKIEHTGKMPANSYFRKTIDANHASIKNDIAAEMRKIIEK